MTLLSKAVQFKMNIFNAMYIECIGSSETGLDNDPSEQSVQQSHSIRSEAHSAPNTPDYDTVLLDQNYMI